MSFLLRAVCSGAEQEGPFSLSLVSSAIRHPHSHRFPCPLLESQIVCVVVLSTRRPHGGCSMQGCGMLFLVNDTVLFILRQACHEERKERKKIASCVFSEKAKATPNESGLFAVSRVSTN